MPRKRKRESDADEPRPHFFTSDVELALLDEWEAESLTAEHLANEARICALLPPDLPPEEISWTAEDDASADAIFAEWATNWERAEARRLKRREREQKRNAPQRALL